MTTREDRTHDILNFLSRPILITTDLWSSSSARGVQLYTTNFPESLIANSMYQDKLKGFVGLRATLVVKVQVNSQPFQQGRLMLHYIPYAQYMSNRVALVNATLQGRSGCPRTDLDISVGTEIEMRIPYVSPHAYYNLITGQGSFGSIFLTVYSQLRDQVSGTGSVEYTVWSHLEDIDLQYPTGANIYTGNAPNLHSFANQLATGKMTEKEFVSGLQERTFAQRSARAFAQMEAASMVKSGVISTGVGQVAAGMNTFSKIPILGSMFTRPAWISAQAANIAKIFGMAKPTNEAPAEDLRNRFQSRMNNYNGLDMSHRLALAADNSIETKPGLAGTSIDEMAISSVVSIPNYWDNFSWPSTGTGSTTGSILWDNYVTPMKIKSYSGTITDRYVTTHMGYLANCHGLWRGSIVYTFKFVKTQYHSGRLMISFIPFYFNTTISTGTPDTARTQRTIVDLRTSTEVSFTVPYVSSRPWMFCVRPESSWLGTNAVNMFNAVSGIVRVEVLNQLVAANNVYPSIDVIVEVSGGPDLTFALPTAPSYIPYSGAFTEEINDDSDFEEIPSRPQAQMMGSDEVVPRNLSQKGIAPQPIAPISIDSNWSPEANCTGEKITSIRQLVKRAGVFYQAELGTTNADSKDVYIAPYNPSSIASSVPTATNTFSLSYYDYFYWLYAFYRGGMRIKVHGRQRRDASPTQLTALWRVTLINSLQDLMNQFINTFVGVEPVSVTKSIQFADYMSPSEIVTNTTTEGMVEFEVPYYNVSHITPAITQAAPSMLNMLKGLIPPTLVRMWMPDNNTTNTDNKAVPLWFYRGVADDFSFMYLLGVPPLVNQGRPTTATSGSNRFP